MVMMGDIHKRQTFGEGYEHVAYAGSMIQQNHGEMLENHGYLIWDVPTRSFTEHHIHNDYGFLTIDVVNGVIPQWVYDEIDTKLPKKSSFTFTIYKHRSIRYETSYCRIKTII